MSEKSKLYRIPAPDLNKDEYKFYPLVRVGRLVPFGYKEDPDDPDMLLPVEEELILFEAAKQYLKRYSLRDVAAWLSEKSGRSISHVGLRKRVMAEQDKQKEYLAARQLAKKFRKAYIKAKRIEATRLGKREPTLEEIDEELFQGLDETIKD